MTNETLLKEGKREEKDEGKKERRKERRGADYRAV
jgi:hypothetical protein